MLRIKNIISTMLYGFSILALPCWAASTNTKSAFDMPGLQVGVYGGVTNSSINPGNLEGLSETDTLHPNGHQLNNFTWGLGAAYRFMLPAAIQTILHDLSIGLDLLSFQTTQKGYVWLYDQPTYNNYYYTIPIKSTRLMADAELTFQSLCHHLFPFIEGGVGIARNTANYYDSPLIVGTSGISVNSHTQNQFAYTIGAGVKFLLPQKFELSFRYLYANLGNAQTSSAASVPLAAPITIPLATNTWLVGLTRFF